MTTLGVLAALPEGLNRNTIQTILLAALAVCFLGVIFVLRTVQKLAMRVALILVFVGVGVGLWIQRDNLAACRTQCTCRLFGQDVVVPDIAATNPACPR